MQNGQMNFLKGLGTGMIAGAALTLAGKVAMQDRKNVAKGSGKLLRAVGEFADGVQTIFK